MFSIAAVRGLEERTSNLFRLKLCLMAERLGSDADWHAAVMANESGFDPAIRNKDGGATGLIQFMPSTAKALGTTTDALAVMSAEEQLAWVERYYKPFTSRMHSATDVYMATFIPCAVGRPDGAELGVRDSTEPICTGTPLTKGAIYEHNAGFDRDHDGLFTNGDVGATVKGLLADAAKRPRIPVALEDDGGADDPGGGILAAGGLILGALIWRYG